MTESAAWRPVGAVDPLTLVEARNQAHHALQLPAMAATVFVPFREDYSHLNFGWVDRFSAFTSHDIPTTSGTVQFGIRLADLTLLLLVDNDIQSMCPMHGKTNSDAKAWLLAEAEKLGLDGEKFTAASHSKIPAHPVADGALYDVAAHAQAMAEFCNYYGNANLILEAVRATYLNIHPGPNEIRMWPHHFDIAVLVTLEEGDPETAKAFGFGFEPGDSSCEQPYFYTYPWPRSQRPEILPALTGLGQWTPADTWFGTLLAGEDICKVTADQQQAAVDAYLRDAAEHCRVIAINHP
ncbi:MAG: hypothetical protein F6K42_03785 [Leptolyngbya sp. SIO1D8]|nr:hypothetical protein [Leptolyngbya sp. SIO1D8]